MKHYVSVLRLVSEMATYLNQPSVGGESTNIDLWFPSWSDIHSNREQRHGESPFIIQGQTKNGYETVTLQRTIGSFYHGHTYRLPYPIELEYLKQSDYTLSDTDWERLHHLFILQYFQWFAYKGISANLLLTENIFTEALAEEGVDSYIFTVEEPITENKIETILRPIYEETEIFEPLRVNMSSARKHGTRWYAAPISSIDVLCILSKCYADNNGNTPYTETMTAHACLLMPMFLVFSLLERETENFQTIDWNRYTTYKSFLPELFSIETPLSHEPEGSLFHYGYMGVNSRGANPVDINFVKRIVSQYFDKMKELAVDLNIATIETKNMLVFERIQADKCNVLLNADTLKWGEEEGETDE